MKPLPEIGRPTGPDRRARRFQPSSQGELLLRYALLDSGAVVWASRRHDSVCRRLPIATASLRASARHFRESCASPTTDPRLLQVEGRALFRDLLTPVADLLPQSVCEWVCG